MASKLTIVSSSSTPSGFGANDRGFREVIAAYPAPLTPAEQRIVSILLADAQESGFLVAAQLAHRGGVHESTVVRLAQKLGYDGYPQLREAVRLDARRGGGNATSRWLRSVEPHELALLVADEIRTLTELPAHVTQDAVDGAARALLAARRIFVFGLDQWRVLAEFMDRRLVRLGLDVVPICYGGRYAAEHMVSFGSADVLLAFGLKGEFKILTRVLTVAEQRGGTSILIADPSFRDVRPAPTHLLAPPRGSDERHTLVAPLLLCYALQFALSRLDPERVTAALDRLDDLE